MIPGVESQQAHHSHDFGQRGFPLATLQRVWAGALIVLMALSWRLWLPAGFSGTEFPRVPLVPIAPPLAAAIDGLGAAAVLASSLVILLRRRVSWPPFATLLVGLALLFLSNQHRLQPWAYQAWLYALIFAALAPTAARRFVIALTISIYAYSALGKLDQQFLHTVGADFVAVLMPWLDRSSDFAAEMLPVAALALPLAELGLAILLAVPRSRRVGGYAAIVMHGVLIVILGPLGLRHSAAVIAWNLFLAIQAWLLFARPVAEGASAEPLAADRPNSRAQPAAAVAALIVLAALSLPLLERSGYWDHWLSWSLYSPHTSRVDLQIHRSELSSLGKSAIDFTRPSDEQDGWYDVAIDRWSLAELAVPVYPQARFQLGVAEALAQELASPDAIRIKIRGVADRRTGRRSQLWLLGRKQIEHEAKRYWLLPHR